MILKVPTRLRRTFGHATNLAQGGQEVSQAN
jgi:hypothetical protein